jgi:hypothetical protein
MSYLQKAKNDEYHKLPTAFARLFCDADKEIEKLKLALERIHDRSYSRDFIVGTCQNALLGEKIGLVDTGK